MEPTDLSVKSAKNRATIYGSRHSTSPRDVTNLEPRKTTPADDLHSAIAPPAPSGSVARKSAFMPVAPSAVAPPQPALPYPTTFLSSLHHHSSSSHNNALLSSHPHGSLTGTLSIYNDFLTSQQQQQQQQPTKSVERQKSTADPGKSKRRSQNNNNNNNKKQQNKNTKSKVRDMIGFVSQLMIACIFSGVNFKGFQE